MRVAAHGWGKGPRLGRSQNEALRSSYKDGSKECVIRTFFCDAKGGRVAATPGSSPSQCWSNLRPQFNCMI
jgi:hypothetical protein